MTDHMRGDCLSAEGHPVLETPILDYLAACGTRFTHAYTAVPSCIPARASLWSGQNQWHTGVLGMGWGQGPLPNDFPHTIAGELTQAGYRTHGVGKGHFSPIRASMGFESFEFDESGRSLIKGFEDEFLTYFNSHAPEGVSFDAHGIDWNSWLARPWHTQEYLHPTAWTTARAIDFLDTRSLDRPFFLHISFSRPHSPYIPPEFFFNMYLGRTDPPSVGDWAEMHDVPTDAVDMIAWRGRVKERQIDRARAGFYGEIGFIDNQIGRLLTYMRRFHREALHNTWIIFTSDHGDMLGDHNLWRKTYPYEGSARIPLIVVPPTTWGHEDLDLSPELWNIMPDLMPPVRKGKQVRDVAEEAVTLYDLMPSIMEMAGLPIPESVDGRSMLPLMLEPSLNWRPYLHGEHCLCYAPEQEMQYVTDGLRKFVWLPRIGIQQFFDLQTDPQEQHNLIYEPGRKDEIDRWRGNLIKELESRDCGWVENGALVTPPNKPLVSPFKDIRWQGDRS
jgi:arylsulfatase